MLTMRIVTAVTCSYNYQTTVDLYNSLGSRIPQVASALITVCVQFSPPACARPEHHLDSRELTAIRRQLFIACLSLGAWRRNGLYRSCGFLVHDCRDRDTNQLLWDFSNLFCRKTILRSQENSVVCSQLGARCSVLSELLRELTALPRSLSCYNLCRPFGSRLSFVSRSPVMYSICPTFGATFAENAAQPYRSATVLIFQPKN